MIATNKKTFNSSFFIRYFATFTEVMVLYVKILGVSDYKTLPSGSLLFVLKTPQSVPHTVLWSDCLNLLDYRTKFPEEELEFPGIISSIYSVVCCGVRGRALTSHTGVRGFEPQCGCRMACLIYWQLWGSIYMSWKRVVVRHPQ